MTEEQLNSLFLEQQHTLRQLGIPLSQEIQPRVVVNTRAQRRLGCCIRKEGVFIIEVSHKILENPQLLKVTLLHELLHTCYGCQNHGKRWKAYATKVGAALGVEIQRTVKMEGEPESLRQDAVKYILRCKACGKIIPRRRMSKAVKYPNHYRCPCGGKLERLQ